MERIQVLLTAEERETFRRLAAEEGLSLSAWMRRAALARQAELAGHRELRTVDDLRAFFEACDQRERGEEPSWEQHLDVIERSRRSGESGT